MGAITEARQDRDRYREEHIHKWEGGRGECGGRMYVKGETVSIFYGNCQYFRLMLSWHSLDAADADAIWKPVNQADPGAT